jgi:hypothetical protein
MNRIRSNKHLLFIILFSICCMIVTSCEKKIKKTEQVEQVEEVAPNSDTIEEVLTKIAESNLKIVAIAQKALESKIQNNTKSILKETESNHIKLKNKIRKIAKDNFIIIPNTLYDTTTLKSFISEVNTKMYLKRLENSLINELTLYNSITATSTNNELKELSKEAIPIIQKDIDSIQKQQNLYH